MFDKKNSKTKPDADKVEKTNKQIKLFIVEAIGALVEAIGNRKEEEKVLRSYLVHYDDYFSATPKEGPGYL